MPNSLLNYGGNMKSLLLAFVIVSVVRANLYAMDLGATGSSENTLRRSASIDLRSAEHHHQKKNLNSQNLKGINKRGKIESFTIDRCNVISAY